LGKIRRSLYCKTFRFFDIYISFFFSFLLFFRIFLYTILKQLLFVMQICAFVLSEKILFLIYSTIIVFLNTLIFQYVGEISIAYTIETSGISSVSFSVISTRISNPDVRKCTPLTHRDKVQPARKFRNANVKATNRNFCWWFLAIKNYVCFK